jgi:EAL domain-containing protein (putative c-di-GMP-specific phosphodiesterase class I)
MVASCQDAKGDVSAPQDPDSGRLVQRRRTLVAVRGPHVLDSLTVALQPIYELDARTIFGYEALLRGPGGSALPVWAWFDAAAREGWLPALSERAWHLAFQAAEQIPDDRWLFVNWDFRQPLPTLLPRARTVVEVSARRAVAPEHVEAIHALGALAGLDDYRQGVTSLELLTASPLDLLKLDRPVTAGLARHPQRRRWLGELVTLIRLARPQVTVVAEGVENQADLEAVVACGVQYGQGFWLGRPAPPEHALAASSEPSCT